MALPTRDNLGVLPLAIRDTARAFADLVDTEGRFPQEAIDQVRAAGGLGLLVPRDLGGPGGSLRQAAEHCQQLAGQCGSSGMILAMHHIQVACLLRHAKRQPWHAAFLTEVHERQLLLASCTSEAGVGGAMRTSQCAIERQGDQFNLLKNGTAVSYGAHSDALLVTARATPDSPAGDQVLTVLRRDQLDLTQVSAWDSLGMRGTSTGAFTVKGHAATAQIIDTPFAEIASMTMTPVSHILWGAVWTGIAGDAVLRARQALRERVKPGETSAPQGAVDLAEAIEWLQQAEARLRVAIADFDWENPGPRNFAAVASDNGLKSGTADACLKVVQCAMAVCGFQGYARQGPYSISRHLRDLNSAPIMISNFRMRETSAQMLMAQRPLFGLSGDLA
jgi:acyl-CoA dehydrogenase